MQFETLKVLSVLDAWLAQFNLNTTEFIVAFSGGIDSQALLHAMYKLKQNTKFNLKAAHVNHQISSNAMDWQQHCEIFCAKYQIPLSIHTVDIQAEALSFKKDSLEVLARRARYGALESIVKPKTVLLTAHHEDDQSETVMMRILRGTGVEGLSGIRPLRQFGQGSLARPLLSVSKSDIQDYADTHKLTFCWDESNDDVKIRRNFFRHSVFPILKEHYPALNQTISRLASLSAVHAELLDGFMDEVLRKIQIGNQLSMNALQNLPSVQQSSVLRYWLKSQNFQPPSLIQCQEILRQMLEAVPDKNPQICVKDYYLYRYQDRLSVVRGEAQDGVPGSWSLKRIKGSGICQFKAPFEKLVLKARVGGERLLMPGGWHKSVKNFYQEQKIPPRLRSQIPLVYLDELNGQQKLIALGNLWILEGFEVASKDEWGWFISH